jgi:hypothetical protein
MKLKKLTIFIVYIFSSTLGIGIANAEYYPSGIQKNVSEQTLRDNGWVLFYEETYDEVISANGSELRPGESYVLFTGRPTGTTTLTVLAAAPTADVFTSTAIDTPQLINGTYWYYTPSTSIGFSPNSTIYQNTADLTSASRGGAELGDGDQRLSWHLGTIAGGWRLGTDIELNYSTSFVKQVWMWNGVRTVAQPEVKKKEEETPKRRTTNLTFGESLYGSDTLSDPTGELREMVDLINRDVTPATISMTYSSLLK